MGEKIAHVGVVEEMIRQWRVSQMTPQHYMQSEKIPYVAKVVVCRGLFDGCRRWIEQRYILHYF